MVKVRLKQGVGFPKMNTSYGLITHEWSIVRDDAYIYKEMEVEGKPQIVVEPISIPKPIIDPKPKPVILPKIKIKLKKTKKIIKKKSPRQRK